MLFFISKNIDRWCVDAVNLSRRVIIIFVCRTYVYDEVIWGNCERGFKITVRFSGVGVIGNMVASCKTSPLIIIFNDFREFVYEKCLFLKFLKKILFLTISTTHFTGWPLKMKKNCQVFENTNNSWKKKNFEP